MLIEPTPALPPSPGRRTRVGAAVVAPFAFLVVVVGAGLLGAATEQGATRPSSTAAPAAVDQPPGPSPTVGPSAPPAFPSRVLGLPTRSVADSLELRRGGMTGDEIVAIRAFATVHPTPSECFVVDGAPTIADALACRREVLLADDADPLLASSDAGVDWIGSPDAMHLHASVYPVVGLVDLDAYAVGAAATTASPEIVTDTPIASVPVVVLGRFDDPRLADPRSSGRHPNEAFAIERVVWVADTWQPRPAIRFLPAVAGEIPINEVRATTSNALPSGTVILSHSIADLGVLARLDPAAAGLARTGATRLGLPEPDAVWYVRVMTRSAAPVDTLAGDTAPRRLAWVVMSADGVLLGTATED
jgi:hypothetical protein